MAADSIELVGREEELRRLDAFVSGPVERGDAFVLVGEAGIGKTALWRAGVESARARGFTVLEARPTEPEQGLTFAGLADLLSGVHEEIGGLPSPQRRALRIALLLEEPASLPFPSRPSSSS